MARVLLLHWNASEAAERAERLRRAGHSVRASSDNSALRDVRESPPDAFVIDLGRLPSQGLALATWLRAQAAARRVPIVFVDGEAEKVARARSVLPDATYARWPGVSAALTRAGRRPPRDPLVASVFAAYVGRPLAAKLGLKRGARYALLGGPPGFERTLGTLPDGARASRRTSSAHDVRLLFVTSRAELARRFALATRGLQAGGPLWIAWPKRASRVSSDLTEQSVGAFGLAKGWVDYKICAIDETWSGLCFTKRR